MNFLELGQRGESFIFFRKLLLAVAKGVRRLHELHEGSTITNETWSLWATRQRRYYERPAGNRYIANLHTEDSGTCLLDQYCCFGNLIVTFVLCSQKDRTVSSKCLFVV